MNAPAPGSLEEKATQMLAVADHLATMARVYAGMRQSLPTVTRVRLDAGLEAMAREVLAAVGAEPASPSES